MSRAFREEGFTLVEMLVVLGLVALLLAISLPYATTSGDARKLDAAAEIVASKLRETQAAALFSNRERSLMVELAARRLVQTDPGKMFDLPDGMDVQIITVENEILTDAGVFRFFPDGGSTGGKFILSKGGLKREIAISWLTGAVVVSGAESP